MPGFWIPLMVGLQAPNNEYRLPAGTALVRQMIRLVTNTAEVCKHSSIGEGRGASGQKVAREG